MTGGTESGAAERTEPGAAGRTGAARRAADSAGEVAAEEDREEMQPCLRCGVPIPARLMGCKGGHCPNCGHPYPHGDCSD